jgi:hypothetical protein
VFEEKTWLRKVTVREGKGADKRLIKKIAGVALIVVALWFVFFYQGGTGETSGDALQWILGQAVPADISNPNWTVGFDDGFTTDACKNQDPDVYLFQETLEPDVYGRFTPTYTPVFSFCGTDQYAGEYDDEENEFIDHQTLIDGLFTYELDRRDNLAMAEPSQVRYLAFIPDNSIRVVGAKMQQTSGSWECESYCCRPTTTGDQVLFELREIGSCDSADPRYECSYTAYPCITPLRLKEDGTKTTDGYCYFEEPLTLQAGRTYVVADPDRVWRSSDASDYQPDSSGRVGYYGDKIENCMQSASSPAYLLHLIVSQDFNARDFQYTIPRLSIPEYLHVRKYSCILLPDYLLVTETFDAGTPINQYSFRFPVNYFCNEYPIIKTDEATNKVGRDYMVYRDIVDGETVTIPGGQTWTFFYVIKNNNLIPAVCDNGTYDPELDRCVVKPGVVHVCSEGQFDPALGLCVIQAESQVICDQGYYDVVQGLCIYHPPIQAVCLRGIYNPDREVCEYTPEVDETACEEGYTYNEDTGKCEKYPEKTIICPGNSAYNVETDTCEYTPETEYVCPQGGTYDPVGGVCILEAPAEAVCTQGVLTWMGDHYACVISPDLHHQCVQGLYDPERDACVVTPNLEYLCLNGEFDPETGACVIMPQERIYCREEFVYDIGADKCVRYPGDTIRCPENYAYDTLADVCFKRPETGVSCDPGTVYNPDRDICEYTPEVGVICPGDTVYNSETDTCDRAPEEMIICNDGYEYDNELDRCVRQAEELILPGIGVTPAALGGIAAVIIGIMLFLL